MKHTDTITNWMLNILHPWWKMILLPLKLNTNTALIHTMLHFCTFGYSKRYSIPYTLQMLIQDKTIRCVTPPLFFFQFSSHIEIWRLLLTCTACSINAQTVFYFTAHGDKADFIQNYSLQVHHNCTGALTSTADTTVMTANFLTS